MPGWRNTIWQTLLALDPTLTRLACSSELVNPGGDFWVDTPTGTGAATALTTVDGGGAQVASGATAGGIQIIRLCTNASTGKVVANARTSHWAIYSRNRITAKVTASGQIIAADAMFDGTAQTGFGMAGAVSTANWVAGNFSGTPVDTGVAVDTSGWVDTLTWNDGTNVRQYLNGTLVRTALSTTITAASGLVFAYANNTGASTANTFQKVRWAVWTADT